MCYIDIYINIAFYVLFKKTVKGVVLLADVLRIVTPYVNKNQSAQLKPQVEPTVPFNIQDPTKVIQTHNQSEILKHNTNFLEGQDAPTLLLTLLRDPAVAATYLKNIFLLEETFKLLSAKNTTTTEQIEQYIHNMFVPTEDIANEMVRQEKESSGFKGEIFDLLRKFCAENPDNAPLLKAVANELKSINNLLYKDDILGAVINNLSFLKDNLSTSPDLVQKLTDLIIKFSSNEAYENFAGLKADTLSVLNEIEESILFTPKLAKNVSITIYNLSRFNDNVDYFKEATFNLKRLINIDDRRELTRLLDEFMVRYQSGGLHRLTSENSPFHSKVIDSLVSLLNFQSATSKESLMDVAKTEKILHSLLSSPCNFTPLLHYIIPSHLGDIRSFAEMWINPQSDEHDYPEGSHKGKGIHFLMVMDIDGVGRFEVEFFAHETTKFIDLSLYCPKGLETQFTTMMRTLPQLLHNSEYKLGRAKVDTLKEPRSLMDVFKSLPYRRVGVDVTV